MRRELIMSSKYDYNKKYVPLAQHLRKNMTSEERRLWYQCLSLLPVPAHRQKNIGNYIVDFYIPQNKLVIEADGSQHETLKGKTDDRERDEYLRSLGITVVRYTNTDINQHFGWVARDILRHLDLFNDETMEMMRKEYRRRKGYKDV